MQAAVLMVLLVGGAFSYYQLGSPLFGCGTVLAGSEIYLWMALCAVQSLLFLAGALSRPARRVYRVLQYLTLPLAAIPLAQIAATDARIFACVAVAAIGYWY